MLRSSTRPKTAAFDRGTSQPPSPPSRLSWTSPTTRGLRETVKLKDGRQVDRPRDPEGVAHLAVFLRRGCQSDPGRGGPDMLMCTPFCARVSEKNAKNRKVRPDRDPRVRGDPHPNRTSGHPIGKNCPSGSYLPGRVLLRVSVRANRTCCPVVRADMSVFAGNARVRAGLRGRGLRGVSASCPVVSRLAGDVCGRDGPDRRPHRPTGHVRLTGDSLRSRSYRGPSAGRTPHGPGLPGRLGLPQAERPRTRDHPLQGPVPGSRRAGRAPDPYRHDQIVMPAPARGSPLIGRRRRP